MFRKTKALNGSRLSGTDGDIGHLKDFFFDDRSWTIRYLVADTGTWLPGRQVLLSPFAVSKLPSDDDKAIEINLTRKQIEDSPSIEEHKPVSRQYEQEYLQYYGWPDYWPGPLLWGPVEAPWAFLPGKLQIPPRQQQHPRQGQDAHLRSVADMSGFSGYQIQALDQVFGHVEYCLFEEGNWAIRYLVCDTRNWWPGKHFLLSPQWIGWVSWSESRVYVDLGREAIRRAPEYDPKTELTRSFEEKLFEHYNRQPYWHHEMAAV